MLNDLTSMLSITIYYCSVLRRCAIEISIQLNAILANYVYLFVKKGPIINVIFWRLRG